MISLLLFLAVAVGIPAILHFLLFKKQFPGMERRLVTVTAVLTIGIYACVLAWYNTVNPPPPPKKDEPPVQALKYRAGVDLAGGSVLVYEVDPRFWRDQTPEFRQTFDSKTLASRIKTRVDPKNLLEVTIRAINTSEDQPPRVEVIMPVREGDIEVIKKLISQQGVLEFRILAYKEADATKFFDKDAIEAAEKELIGFRGVEPITPLNFTNDYQWVELSQHEITHYQRDPKGQNFNKQGKAGFETLTVSSSTKTAQSTSTLAFFHIPDQKPAGLTDKDVDYGRHFVLTRKSLPDAMVTGDNLDPGSIYVDMNGSELVINFRIRTDAQDRFWSLTSEVKQYMAIIFDNKVISAPILIQQLSTGGIITMGARGADGQKQVDSLARILQAGSLPAAISSEPVSEMTMGPGLGEDTIRKGAYSVGFAFLAVVAFMCYYYRFAGFVAIIALFANLLLTIAFMAFANAVFTLPGLAGLVLTLGMAVDANVLIYERLREERERGASLSLAIRNAYDRAFPTIIDTHLTSIFTAVVLYVVGNDQLKGFGITLSVGLLISLFTSLYITRLLFDIGLSKRMLNDLKFRQLFKRPNIDFMRVRNYWFGATVILSIIGLVIFLGRGESGMNIDFTGGTAYTFKFIEPKNIGDVRKAISSAGAEIPEATVDAIYPGSTIGGGPAQIFTLRTTKKELLAIRDKVKSLFGKELLYVKVEPFAVTPVPVDKQGEFKLDKSITFSFTNRPATISEIEKLANEWFAALKVDAKDSFVVTAKEEDRGDRPNAFNKLTMNYKLPADVKDGEASLLAKVSDQYNQPYSDRLEKFDSQFARQTQVQALMAILLSWIAISLYLTFRFHSWRFGVAAVLCLVHDLTFAIGLVGLCHYIVEYVPWLGSILLIEDFKIDLPAVAALLTLVGYSVNDTIVVFDRIREVRGKNPDLTPQMINDSVNQTLSRTVLASLTTFLVVVVLYIFGGEGVKLFSFVMVVGIIIGTYSSIFVASPLLLMLGEGAPVKENRPGQLVASKASK